MGSGAQRKVRKSIFRTAALGSRTPPVPPQHAAPTLGGRFPRHNPHVWRSPGQSGHEVCKDRQRSPPVQEGPCLRPVTPCSVPGPVVQPPSAAFLPPLLTLHWSSLLLCPRDVHGLSNTPLWSEHWAPGSNPAMGPRASHSSAPCLSFPVCMRGWLPLPRISGAEPVGSVNPTESRGSDGTVSFLYRVKRETPESR